MKINDILINRKGHRSNHFNLVKVLKFHKREDSVQLLDLLGEEIESFSISYISKAFRTATKLDQS